ncbi:MAG: hypothetical protein EP330_21825 [Deltaproteobacteria bacterium]|nr:MAG: hypothetical protein EP330_21825 [Deltaproteobacteria bacterium]
MRSFSLFAAIASCLIAMPASAQNCAPGTDITGSIGGTVTAYSCGAGDNNDPGCGGTGGEDLAYFFTAPTTGQIRINTNGSTFDTLLSVNDRRCTGSELTCNDDGGTGTQSSVLVDVTAGRDYWVFVDGYDSFDCGDVELSLDYVDACAPGTDLTSYVNNGIYTGNICGAGDDTAGSCGSDGEEAAYRFVAPTDGFLYASTEGSTFDTVLYLREGACGGTELACNDDGGAGSTSFINGEPVTAGTEYWVFVSGYGSNCGDFELELSIDDGLCDEADIAADLTCSSDLFNQTTEGGSRALNYYTCGTPNAPLDQGYQEVIYTFSPQNNGSVTFVLDGMTRDQDLYVLESTCDESACIEGATAASTTVDSVTFNARRGRTYYIVVEAYGGAGVFDLSFEDGTGGCSEDCDDGVDNDGDGDVDCDDSDCFGEPECANEVCDGLDNDQDGTVDEGFADNDSDGIANCVDVETCDEWDNNGNGTNNEGFPDNDGDGIANCIDTETCDQWDNDGDGTNNEGFPDTDGDGVADCVDAEVCNGQDDDGNGTVDDGFPDNDGDGIANCVDVETCDEWDNDGDGVNNEGFADTDGDGIANCIDTEDCDGLDNNGNGQVDEGFPDDDGDGTANCMDVETCDGVNNDADGLVDEGFPDSDGNGTPDCLDSEFCDGQDNDGNGNVDEGFPDTDGDGIADCVDTETCDGVDNDGDGLRDEGFADTDGDGVADCVDTEDCDGIDNDGNGNIDEGFPNDDGDNLANCMDVEECDGVNNDLDGNVDEGFDSDGDGVADCFDTEVCDGQDNDGDGLVDDDDPDLDTNSATVWYEDSDGDGFGNGASAVRACAQPDGYVADATDCDDRHADRNPDEVEICDGFDNDCDVDVDENTECTDDDGDGFSELGGDCDDTSTSTRPSAREACDGEDDDCDGAIDEGTECTDDDGDGHCEGLDMNGDGTLDCVDGSQPGDCNDGESGVSPSVMEQVGNGIDDDCDGVVDTESPDPDQDGYTALAGDCDPNDASTYPGAPEEADGYDNDCDEEIDEGTAAFDDDGDEYSELDGDCWDDNPDVYPGATEVEDGIDNDCDGVVDEGSDVYDDDGDGLSELEGDCDDTNPDVRPGAEEQVNGVDDDCDEAVDEGYLDADGDGWTEADGDCDDDQGWSNPDANEVCDGLDNDCDGNIDESPCGDQPVVPTDPSGCSCDSTGSAAGLLWLAGLIAIRRRRVA